MARDKPAPEPVEVEPAEADEPMPAWMDPDVARMRRELASERESLRRSSSGASYDELLDRPGNAVKSWLESTRGEKFSTDDEFKTEAADLITRISSEVLGVPLPGHVLTKLDAAAARKGLKHMQSTAAKREAERAEQEAHDAEWRTATNTLDRHLAPGSDAAKTFPLLSAESQRGQMVTDVIRVAAEAGERITWEKAAKIAESHLRRSKPKAAAAAPPKPAAAKAPPAAKPPQRREQEPTQLPTFTPPSRRRNEDTRRAETLAALRRAHDEG